MTYTRKPRSYERGLDSRGGCPYVVLAGSNRNPHPSAKNGLGWGTRAVGSIVRFGKFFNVEKVI
jgi:hypothetical protein